MYDVVVLGLVSEAECGSAGPRVPALQCSDALRAAGAKVEMITARSDADIDSALSRVDSRLVVAVESDGQLRHVVRRMVRMHAPQPSQRPDDLPANRTIPDLPAFAILPLTNGTTDLVAQLGLPRHPKEVAAAVLGERIVGFDLLRHDGGSVTLDCVLLGATDDDGRALAWRGRIEVDDAVLSDGDEPLLALSVANAAGLTEVDGLPLVTSPDPTDGLIDVAVAVPVVHKPLLGKARMRYEVRRARGRAVAVTPREGELPYVDDGVVGTLTRKRSWWVEPGAWRVYTAAL